ncbi:MAG: PEP-CTERM sorting domain-containing protein [Paracoccaceae bacterium]
MTARPSALAVRAALAAFFLALPAHHTAASSVPDFRGQPNTVFAQFERTTSNIAGYELTAFETGANSTFPLFANQPFDADGTPFADLDNDENVLFFLPNFIDPLPFKFIKIGLECEIAACNGIAPTEVLAFDDAVENPSVQERRSGTHPDEPNSRYIHLLIRPNPDWEIIGFGQADLAEAGVFRLTFDTISDVPLPAALPLLALGLVGLGIAARRRPS